MCESLSFLNWRIGDHHLWSIWRSDVTGCLDGKACWRDVIAQPVNWFNLLAIVKLAAAPQIQPYQNKKRFFKGKTTTTTLLQSAVGIIMRACGCCEPAPRHATQQRLIYVVSIYCWWSLIWILIRWNQPRVKRWWSVRLVTSSSFRATQSFAGCCGSFNSARPLSSSSPLKRKEEEEEGKEEKSVFHYPEEAARVVV